MSGIDLRASEPRDAASIAAIYAPYVRHGTASFEVEEPHAEEMLRRRAEILELGLPYLVAETDGEVAGYAYLSRFRPRAAYRFTVENSVYVAERFQRLGVGRLLMQQLLVWSGKAGMKVMVAVIGDPLNNRASVHLHRSLAFEEVGTLHGVGEKFGRILDVLLMQRSLTGM